MPEGLFLPPIARETLLPVEARVARLDEACVLIQRILEDETDVVALQATLASLLWETLVQANWCGFYRRIDERTLAVGPYQGSMGCLRIDVSRGVCGACASRAETLLVPDVSLFPGHIACDSRSRSELVVPIMRGARVEAVLDLDSPYINGFDQAEADRLQRLMSNVFGHANFDG